VLIFSAEPEFSEFARGATDKFEGKCLIGLVVDSLGMPHEMHAIRSLGPTFDANAIKAV
jgi:hypothetical protein